MDDDEISELAEFLWGCCAGSYEGKPSEIDITSCPLCLAFGHEHGVPFLSDGERAAFIAGFDGTPNLAPGMPELFELGKRFRSQALSGEGFR